MSSSFTNGTTAVVPEVVDGYKAQRRSQHVFHSVLAGANTNAPVLSNVEDVWARVAAFRTGTFTAVFASYEPANRLFVMLSGTLPITFADSDRPELGMVFLADGDIGIEQSPARGAWIVTVDYHEVKP